jgi:hypothetical protein
LILLLFKICIDFELLFSRKRKWDLDDQGKKAPPSSTTAKSIKVEDSSDVSESKVSPDSPKSELIDPNLAAGQ